jgi:hypothetical protein
MEFHATEAYFNVSLTDVQYSIKRLCREEKEKVTALINPSKLIVSEKI